MKTLTFSAAIEASDTGRRIISGKIVPFNGEVGNTNVGPVIFEAGAIQIPSVSKIKLLAQHEKNNPIGRMQNYQESADGIYASFKVSASSKGTDFLIMASEGLIDGLSVGVEVIASKERKDGTLIVTAAKLQEVSLVESPAFDNARVLDVAAQATDSEDIAEESLETAEDVLIEQISTAVDGLKQLQEAEKALEESETQTESEASVENTPAATTEAAAAPVAAEASRPTIKASTPYISTNVRHGITSMGRYVEGKIKASQGDAEAREWIAASEDPSVVQAAADSIGTTNPAFNPIQYMKELYVNNRFGAPARDAVSRGTLPTSGMTFQIPSLVTSAGGGSGVAPTVAATAESAAPSNTGWKLNILRELYPSMPVNRLSHWNCWNVLTLSSLTSLQSKWNWLTSSQSMQQSSRDSYPVELSEQRTTQLLQQESLTSFQLNLLWHTKQVLHSLRTTLLVSHNGHS